MRHLLITVLVSSAVCFGPSLIATAQSGQALDTGSWDSPGTGFSVSNRLNCVSGVDPVYPNPTAQAWLAR